MNGVSAALVNVTPAIRQRWRRWKEPPRPGTDVALTPLDTASVAGKVEAPSGPTFLISPRANNSVIAVNRILKQGGEVARTREALSAGGETFPPGTFVVSRGLSPQAAAALAKDTGLTIVGTATPVGAKTIALRAPRVALYKSWTAQMDEEWTRFLFEQLELEFACPGSVLRMKFDVTHPVAYGMPAEAPGMFISSPAFRLTPSFGDGRAPPIATYPGEGILTSGYLKGEKYLKNTVAAAEVLLGKGRLILLGFVVEQRGQPHGTFKLPFNALYYGAAR